MEQEAPPSQFAQSTYEGGAPRLVNTENRYGATSGVKWAPNLAYFAPLSAPFAPTLDRGLIPNPCPRGYREARFGFLLSSLGFTVQQQSHRPRTYIKATACLGARWPLTGCLSRFP